MGNRVAIFVLLTATLAACGGARQTFVPSSEPSGASSGAIVVSDGDVASAKTARILYYHMMAPRRNEARLKYPADLVRKNGPIMAKAASYNVYVNCKTGGESCWGDPEGFEKRLTGSKFAELLKQYTNSPPSSITFGGAFSVTYHTYTKIFYANDLLTVLHAALVKNGKRAGYSSIYHIFLPQGTDTCFDLTKSCYSPKHPRTNNFCAYHETVRFKDVSEVVVASVEPYQKEGFCKSRASSGASALTNSTASTLAHETFESVTDPGPRFAWFNFTFYDEVGDLCENFQWKMQVNGTEYSLQPMYSNRYHACADGP